MDPHKTLRDRVTGAIERGESEAITAIDGALLPDTLYVAAAWHHDCDAYVRVIATSESACQAEIDDAIREEIKRVLDSDCGEACEDECAEHTPDIRESGTSRESRDDVLAAEPAYTRAEIITALVDLGVATFIGM